MSRKIFTNQLFATQSWRAATQFPLRMVLLCVIVPAAISQGATEGELSVGDKRPLLCPNSPNCVSTMDATPSHAIAPYPYRRELKDAKEGLKQVFSGFPRTQLIKEEEEYLHYEVRSFLFGFVDDVEFVFDEASKAIHFRSAARSGYYDFGVNRKRMEDLRGMLEDKL